MLGRVSRTLFAVLAATTVMTAFTACGEGGKKEKKVSSMTMVCDEAFKNIMEQEVEVFEYVYPNNFVLCEYVPQAVAVDSLLSGNTRNAVIGRDITKTERAALRKKFSSVRSMKIAVDAVALIVNPENDISTLSVKEIGQILSGEITRWDQISPEGADAPINVVFDDRGSGLATYMRDSVLNGREFGPNVVSIGSVEKVFETVKERKDAMGVIGVSWLTRSLNERDTTDIASRVEDLQKGEAVNGIEINERMDNSGVKVLSVMRNDALSYKPYQQYIYDGNYPLTRPIYIISTAGTVGAAHKFYTFITSNDGQRLIMRTGIMPARMQINIYEVTTK